MTQFGKYASITVLSNGKDPTPGTPKAIPLSGRLTALKYLACKQKNLDLVVGSTNRKFSITIDTLVV